MQLKRFYILFFSLASAMHSVAQQNPDVIDYINKYKDLAIAEMQRTGVPAAIKLAQGIHETQAGKSDLVLKSNNHFGIKCKASWDGDRVYHDDDKRAECFRSYATPQDSYKDHSDFLRNSERYAFLFQLDPTDYKAWAFGLKNAGYATNPKYPTLLINLIETYNLEQYTLIAMGRLRPQDEIIASGSAIIGNTESSVDTLAGQAPVVTRQYPDGEFMINNTRVVFARSGTSLLSLADRFSITLKRLVDFNELRDENTLAQDQLVFLQRKRKTGASPMHVVEPGESLYSICQSEGIRMESLLRLNHLQYYMQPAIGEKLYLQEEAPAPPILATATMAVNSRRDAPEPGSYYSSDRKVTTHIVKKGETLESIARRYSVSGRMIMEWNRLSDDTLRSGQELMIYKN